MERYYSGKQKLQIKRLRKALTEINKIHKAGLGTRATYQAERELRSDMSLRIQLGDD